jgi:hypothetical protein
MCLQPSRMPIAMGLSIDLKHKEIKKGFKTFRVVDFMNICQDFSNFPQKIKLRPLSPKISVYILRITLRIIATKNISNI